MEWKSKVIGTDAMKHPVYESSSNLSNLGKLTALGLGIGCSACQRACTFTCADGNCCVIVGLSSDSTYTATIRSRGPNAVVGGEMMCLLSRVDLVVEGCPALHGGGG